MKVLAFSSFFSILSVTAFANPSRTNLDTKQIFAPGQIIGEFNLEPIESILGTHMYEYSRAVAKADLGGGWCTAIRLSKDLFMTNHHCYSTTSCSRTSFILGQEKELSSENLRTYKCKKIISKSSGLDFALYQVKYDETDEVNDLYPTATISIQPLTLGQMLLVPGFPVGANYKRVDSSENCKLSMLPNSSDNIKHSCDTKGGSSGSAVFDRESGNVIALHWGYSSSNANSAHTMEKIVEYIRADAPDYADQLTIIE